jgi:hypothetical protein
MNRTVYTLLFVFLSMIGVNLWAQQKSAGKAAAKGDGGNTPGVIMYPTVYLGHSNFSGGNIKKAEFDRLLKEGLTSKDSSGNKYKVLGFEFNYAERQLFEDSAGNLKVMTEIVFEYCPGDTITSGVSASIYERTKPGDTVYINKVKVVKYIGKTNKTLPDTAAIAAKAMKCVIVK